VGLAGLATEIEHPELAVMRIFEDERQLG